MSNYFGSSPFPVTNVSPRSSLAGFEFNGGRSYRLFFQTDDRAIAALATDDYGIIWKGPSIMVPAGFAAPDTPMVSVRFTGADGSSNSRTYFLDSNYRVAEVSVHNGRRSHCALEGGRFQAASFSKIGAIAGNNGKHPYVRIYYQSTDGHIHEIAWDGNPNGPYVHSHKFPIPMRGTALAFVNETPESPKGPHIRGFYEHSNNVAMEVCHQPSGVVNWFPGMWHLDRHLEKQAVMAASAVPGHEEVFFVDNHRVVQSIWNGSGWEQPRVVPDVVVSRGGLLAVCYYLKCSRSQAFSPHTRLFYIGQDGRIHWKRGIVHTWVDGNLPIISGQLSSYW